MYCCRKYITLFLISALISPAYKGQEHPALRQAADTSGMLPQQDGDGESNGRLDGASVEEVSYRLYLEKKWPALAGYCTRAIRMHFDYYYLRVRAGVAYFEMGKYRQSVVHFKAALAFSPRDDFANGYLYYAYLYSERFEEAKCLTRSFSPALAASYNVGALSPVDFITVESGIKAPDSTRQFKNAVFTDISFSHSISKKIFLLHSLTYFMQGEERFEVQQLQYYLRGTLPLKNGFLLSAGFHFVNVNADQRNFVDVVGTNTVLYHPAATPGNPSPQPQLVTYTISERTEKITKDIAYNFITALTLTRRSLYADYWAGVTVAGFDTTTQFQLGAGFNIYPFRNNRLALGGTAYLHTEEPFTKSYVAVAPTINIYPAKKLCVTFLYLYNKGPNISENTGAFVSNSIDYTTNRASLTVSGNVARTLWLYGTYGYEQKKHLTESYRYDYNIFAVGIKIIPQFRQ